MNHTMTKTYNKTKNRLKKRAMLTNVCNLQERIKQRAKIKRMVFIETCTNLLAPSIPMFDNDTINFLGRHFYGNIEEIGWNAYDENSKKVSIEEFRRQNRATEFMFTDKQVISRIKSQKVIPYDFGEVNFTASSEDYIVLKLMGKNVKVTREQITSGNWPNEAISYLDYVIANSLK